MYTLKFQLKPLDFNELIFDHALTISIQNLNNVKIISYQASVYNKRLRLKEEGTRTENGNSRI